MIELWHCVSARSFRPLWLLAELGLREGEHYRLHLLDFPPRVRAPQFLTSNPLGTVPWLIDGQTQMSESAAMCEYLALRYAAEGRPRLHVEASEADFGAYLNYLHMGEATLTFPQTLVLRYTHMEPPERAAPQVSEDYARWFMARLRVLESHLDGREYLCAGRFTAADISVGYALLLAQHLGLASRFKPGVAAYWQRLQARPAYLAALQIQHDAALAQGVSVKPSPDIRPADLV
jgi:glutathione S-transferase